MMMKIKKGNAGLNLSIKKGLSQSTIKITAKGLEATVRRQPSVDSHHHQA